MITAVQRTAASDPEVNLQLNSRLAGGGKFTYGII
jgi:hypothetical protein